MAQQPSAILAINSLDRFITNHIDKPYSFQAIWIAGSFSLIYQSGPTPIVGSVFPRDAPQPPDIPVPTPPNYTPTVIIAWNPALNTVTLNKQVTGTVIVPTDTYWTINTQIPLLNNSLIQQYKATLPFFQTLSEYSPALPYGNNFILQSQSAYIYGYIKKIVVSQIQIQYGVPTVNTDLNDVFYIGDGNSPFVLTEIGLPNGFYTPDELAAVMQQTIRAEIPAFTTFTVSFVENEGFVFQTQNPAQSFYFPSPLELEFVENLNQREINAVLKTYRLIGMTVANSLDFTAVIQRSSNYPNFLYTPYIDIYSDTLTNYQKIKDTDTTISNQKGLVARAYVSGVGNPQTINGDTALGSSPFTVTLDLNSPKVIRWTPDVTVTSIDIQLKDQYGELLPGYEHGYLTEFQMTVLCIEDE